VHADLIGCWTLRHHMKLWQCGANDGITPMACFPAVPICWRDVQLQQQLLLTASCPKPSQLRSMAGSWLVTTEQHHQLPLQLLFTRS
jgi:hypothetical protein